MKNSIEKFKSAFPDNHSLIVALHSRSIAHALEGAEIALTNGAHGVAVVTHVIAPVIWLEAIRQIKEKYPHHQAVLNILQRDPKTIFLIMKELEQILPDGIWTDNARISGIDYIPSWHETDADDVRNIQEEMWWKWLYFGGLDFKHQKHLDASAYPFAVQQAKKYLDIITTSGDATWVSADKEKVKNIKELAWNYPVWLASGVMPENIGEYIKNTDISIVASWISKDYYNLDPAKVLELANIIYVYNKKMARKRFEAETLKQYNVETVTELDNYIRNNGIINIWWRPESAEVEKQLSNLYPSPFIFDGVEYASIEAFWMSIKYPESYIGRDSIKLLDWIKAKRSWEDAKFLKSFKYQWKEIVMWSEDHHYLLKRALKAKLQQYPDILQALLNTWDRPLIHIVFTKDRQFLLADSKTIPWVKFAQIYTELRDEFKNK